MTAVPSSPSASGAASRVTVWAVFQVEVVKASEAPDWMVMSSSPPAFLATATVTRPVGRVASLTV